MKTDDYFNYEEGFRKNWIITEKESNLYDEWTMGIGEIKTFDTVNNFINAISEICIENPNDLSFGEDDTYCNNRNMNYRIKLKRRNHEENEELKEIKELKQQEKNDSNVLLGKEENDNKKNTDGNEGRPLVIINQGSFQQNNSDVTIDNKNESNMDKKSLLEPNKEILLYDNTKNISNDELIKEVEVNKEKDKCKEIINHNNDSKQTIFHKQMSIDEIESQKKIIELTERIEKTERKYSILDKSNKNLLEEIDLFKVLREININNQTSVINNTHAHFNSNRHENDTIKRNKSQGDISIQSYSLQRQQRQLSQQDQIAIKRIKSEEKIKLYTTPYANNYKRNSKINTPQLEKDKKLYIDLIQTNNKTYSKLHNKENHKNSFNGNANDNNLNANSNVNETNNNTSIKSYIGASLPKQSNTTHNIYTKALLKIPSKSIHKINKNSYLKNIQEPISIIELNKSQMYFKYQSSFKNNSKRNRNNNSNSNNQLNNQNYYNNTKSFDQFKLKKNSFYGDEYPSMKDFETLGLNSCVSSYVNTKQGNKITSTYNTIELLNNNTNNSSNYNQGNSKLQAQTLGIVQYNEDPYWNIPELRKIPISINQSQSQNQSERIGSKFKYVDWNQFKVIFKENKNNIDNNNNNNDTTNATTNHNQSQQTFPQNIKNENQQSITNNTNHNNNNNSTKDKDKTLARIPFYILSTKNLMHNVLNSIYEKPKKLNVIYSQKKPSLSKKPILENTWIK